MSNRFCPVCLKETLHKAYPEKGGGSQVFIICEMCRGVTDTTEREKDSGLK